MAKTAVADIIIPTEFEKYAIERTAELSRFGESGIIEMAPEFDALAQGGGREVKMPFWKDLTATRQMLSDSASLAVNKITSDQDIARIHNDAQVWSVNHLAKVISGDDPMQAIVDLVAGYWARTDEGLGHFLPQGNVRRGLHVGQPAGDSFRIGGRHDVGDEAERCHVRGCVRQAGRCGQQADRGRDALGDRGSAEEARSD